MIDFHNNGRSTYPGSQGGYGHGQNTDAVGSLAGLTGITQKDNKYYWLGMEVSKELAIPLQALTSSFPTYASDFLRTGVYDHTKHYFTKLNTKFQLSSNPFAAHKAGLLAASVMTAALIGIQPGIEISQAIRKQSQKRKEIRKEMAVVLEGNKDAYKNNEVIKTAMERAHGNLVMAFKHAISEWPTLVANSIYAVGGHKALVREKTGKAKAEIAQNISREDLNKVRLDRIREQKLERDTFEGMLQAEGYQQLSAHDKEEMWQDFRKQGKLPEAMQGDKPGDKDVWKSLEEYKNAVMGVATAGTLYTRQLSSKHADALSNKPSAYELIAKMHEQFLGGNYSPGADISKSVIEIFQQNERDRGRPPIGQALAEKFEPLAKRIAEVIAAGELDPLVLVNLVGEGKVINKRRFIKEEQLEELLDKERKSFSLHEKTPLDEFLADFQTPATIMEAIKENIRTLPHKEKAVFVSLLSDEVAEKAGVPKCDINGLRKEGHDDTYEVVGKETMVLGQQSREELKKKGLSDKRIDGIMSLYEQLIAGDENALKSAVDSGNTVVGAVRNAMLHEQVEEKQKWTDIIKKSPDMATLIAEAKTKKEEKEQAFGANVDTSALDEETDDKSFADKKKHSAAERGESMDMDDEMDHKSFASEKRFDADEPSAAERVKKKRHGHHKKGDDMPVHGMG